MKRCKIWIILLTVIGIGMLMQGCSGTKAPDTDTVTKDLETSLLDYNSHWTIREYELGLSQSEDKQFTATYNVSAESRYAEIELVANVLYTRYDQGWEMDSCDWEEISCVVSKVPEDGDLDTVLNERASQVDETLDDVKYNNFYLGDNSELIGEGELSAVIDPLVNYEGGIVSSWYYSKNDDAWNFEGDEYSGDFVLSGSIEGEWKLSTSLSDGKYLYISNQTDTGFDIVSDGNFGGDEPIHVERIPTGEWEDNAVSPEDLAMHVKYKSEPDSEGKFLSVTIEHTEGGFTIYCYGERGYLEDNTIEIGYDQLSAD